MASIKTFTIRKFIETGFSFMKKNETGTIIEMVGIFFAPFVILWVFYKKTTSFSACLV